MATDVTASRPSFTAFECRHSETCAACERQTACVHVEVRLSHEDETYTTDVWLCAPCLERVHEVPHNEVPRQNPKRRRLELPYRQLPRRPAVPSRSRRRTGPGLRRLRPVRQTGPPGPWPRTARLSMPNSAPISAADRPSTLICQKACQVRCSNSPRINSRA